MSRSFTHSLMRESDIERAALRSVPSTTASLVGIERNAARNNRSRSLTALLAVLGWSAILSTTGAESTMAAIVTTRTPSITSNQYKSIDQSMINIEYHQVMELGVPLRLRSPSVMVRWLARLVRCSSRSASFNMTLCSILVRRRRSRVLSCSAISSALRSTSTR